MTTINNADKKAEFNSEDADALLKLQYDEYTSKDVELGDLPDLGVAGNLIINEDDCTETYSYSSYPSTSTLVQGANASSSQNENVCCSYEESLALNLKMQRKLIEGLNKIRSLKEKMKTYQATMKQKLHEMEFSPTDVSKKRYTKPVSLFATPYFRDVKGRVPPDNADTIAKTKNCDLNAYVCMPKAWTKEEKDNLVTAVSINALNIALKPLKLKRDHLRSKIRDVSVPESQIGSLSKQVQELDQKMKNISKRPLTQLLEDIKGRLDWIFISASCMKGMRSEIECEIMWENYLSVFIKRSKFTAEEDNKLTDLVENEYNYRDWDSIAESLQSQRSAFQCFTRYQTHLNKGLVKKFWSADEDERLLALIEKMKVGKWIPWSQVVAEMPGRTRMQILNRYSRTIGANILKTPWSKEEDAMLIACEKKMGVKWNDMIEFLPGRSSYACRERFVNSLDQLLKVGNWSKEEDIALIDLIKKHGYGKWANIARELPGRTDNMCLVRSNIIKQHSLVKKDGKCNNTLVKKLKPDAPTKTCALANARMKTVRETAYDTLQDALNKVQPSLLSNCDVYSLDLSLVNKAVLHSLHKELYSRDFEICSTVWKPKYERAALFMRKGKVLPKRKCYRRVSVEDDTDVDDLVEETQEEEPTFTIDDRVFIRKVLEKKFEDCSGLMELYTPRKAIALSSRETAECTIYKRFLYKNFFCQASFNEEADECFVIGNVDYSVSLNSVVHFFMQPPITEGHIVLAPNSATMTAFEVIDQNKHSLQKMSNFVHNSKEYAEYLGNLWSEPPPCKKCKPPSEVKGQTPNEILSNMQAQCIMSTDIMLEAAQTESSSFQRKGEECMCEELANSKWAFELLRRRFLAMFLWPSMLARTPLSQHQVPLTKKMAVCSQYFGAIKKEVKAPRKRYKYKRPSRAKKQVPVDIKDKVEIKSDDNQISAKSDDNKVSAKSDDNKISAKSKRKKTEDRVYAPSHKKIKVTETVSTMERVRRSSRACVVNRQSFGHFYTED